jgi:serine phosphatase RsbU (regulator of sigma subunit)
MLRAGLVSLLTTLLLSVPFARAQQPKLDPHHIDASHVGPLGSLNLALHAQGGIGFTTACCVRLQADGAFAVANAGHISPYVDGAEWETAPGLPIGLAAETEYEERFGQLGGHGRMVLMSDGVVEARSKTGELYGFDRLAPLTLQPAQAIAATAQALGQDDDITVLSLACTAQVSA